ncbi:MAG: carboxypeptidase regulatory-like domain-containing protein [Acidobacteriota bacterium]
MKRLPAGFLASAVVSLCATVAFAQTTGSINGNVADNTGAVLPGVTVTATSPSQMGVQTAITNDAGSYRFPSLAPGVYRLVYELSGFSNVVREEIIVSIGFTATVNVQLQVATLQETVTVTGQSPVVDVTNSNQQTNFTAEALANLPNARDIWSLIGQTPGMMVTRFDVGGSRAGTQTGFSAFGYSGQVRIQVDGVNTTEGTGAAGFYYDYGSFDELQLATDGNDAQAATPGTQLNALIKSGGNQFRGTFHFDYQNESLQGNNIDLRLTRLGSGEGTRILRYRDPNIDAGGPIIRDKLWYYGSYRDQNTGVTVTGFPAEKPALFDFPTRLQNATYKVTYQVSTNNKIGHYIQMGRKVQAHRGASASNYLWSQFKQDSISYAGNVDWNSVVSPTFYFNTRVAAFGYNWPNLPYGANGELNDNLTLRIRDQASGNTAGSDLANRNDRRRTQFDWTGMWYRDNWAASNHSIKFGVVSELEGQLFREEGFVGHYRTHFNSTSGADFTTPYRVQIYNTPRDSANWAWHHGAFVNDQIQKGRVTMNLGVRWDYYSSYYPDQEILPGPFRSFFYGGAALPNGYRIAATPFAGTWQIPGVSDIRQFSSLAPRVGVAWDLFGNGKTTIKANYGRFYHNTGIGSGTVNPAQSISYTFNWSDLNSDRVFQMNEFGTFVSSSGGTSQLIASDLRHTYTDSYSVWFERELMANMGFRAGYTYRDDGNNSSAVELNRLGSLYTDLRSFADPGPDGTVGTADDGDTIRLFDIPQALLLPSRTMTSTIDSIIVVDRAIDFTLTKRMSNRWSLQTNFLYNWDRDRGNVQNPNQERFNDNTVTIWSWKANGTWQAPFGLVVTPAVRYQAGDSLARLVQITLRTGTFNYRAEREGDYREDSIWLFDTRLEKRLRFANNRSLGLFFDAYNMGNSNAAEVQDDIVGRRTTTVGGASVNYQRFLRPTAVLAPRVFRFGLKLGF